MRTFTKTAILLALPLTFLLGRDAPAISVVTVDSNVAVHDATQDQIDLVRWAVGRYERAGLRLPAMDVYFHADRRRCAGNTGLYGAGRVEMCIGPGWNAIPRMTILHELGHAWSERAVTGSLRDRFLRLRGLQSWDSQTRPWSERGWEQVAEIMAWGLGDRLVTPRIADHDPADLEAAFELVTGSRPLDG
jgi:hypothetical protein